MEIWKGFTMKKFLLIAVISSLAVFCFAQEQQTEKQKAIEYLLEVTDTRSQAEQIYDMILPQFTALAPDVPGEFWDMFRENMDFDSFVRDFIPLYDKFYTLEDINALIAFYESPVGKKMTALTPQFTAEAMALGQTWGYRIAEKIINSLRDEGYLDT
jgi:hypothetical protein